MSLAVYSLYFGSASSKPTKSNWNFFSEKALIDENSSKTSFRPDSTSHLNDSTCATTRFGISVKGFLNRLKYFFTLCEVEGFTPLVEGFTPLFPSFTLVSCIKDRNTKHEMRLGY